MEAISVTVKKVSFIRFGIAHRRIGILQDPNLHPDKSRAVGLDHLFFRYDALEDIAEAYKERKARGFLSTWRRTRRTARKSTRLENMSIDRT